MYLFVYGTLRKGHKNHHIIDSLEYLGNYITKNNYYYNKMKDIVYKTDNNIENETEYTQITGELYKIPDKSFISYIDNFEKHPNYFYRENIYVLDKNNKTELSYIYFKV